LFNGNVTSRTPRFAGGTMKTLGFLPPGEYQCNTGNPEVMDTQSGRREVLTLGSARWRPLGAGKSFGVPAVATVSVRSGPRSTASAASSPDVSRRTDHACP
jgi:uncharacterized protein YaiE (UPF0345 family)